MQAQGNHQVRTLILGVTAALTSCLLAFDDLAYDSKDLVNIFKKGASKPPDAWRSYGYKKAGISTWYTVKVASGANGASELGFQDKRLRW